MLGTRIATASVLLALFAAALLAPSAWPFAALTLAFVAAAAWEWGRLNEAPVAFALAMAILLAAGGAAAIAAGWAAELPAAAWRTVALLWVAGGGLALRGGPTAWPQVPRALRWLVGWAALGMAWLALARARALGLDFMMSVFCLVWVSDIAAFAGGRAFGRRKLAPSISPGKTWEGVLSAIAGVVVLGLVWRAVEPAGATSLYALLESAFGIGGALVALVVLTGVGVGGDLFESLAKRAAGVKDSSRLLPGHGGVLDRIDALLPVFPVALALTQR